MVERNLVAIPSIALAVRQPWAWAIIYGGKDIENRSWHAVDSGGMRACRIAIHASKGLTRAEYYDAAEFMLSIGVKCPAPADLQRGGIIGAVDVIEIVKNSSSPWFQPGPPSTRPRGLVLANPQPCAFTPAVGQLGYFNWTPADPAPEIETPPWMLASPKADPSPAISQIDLFA